MVHYIQIKMSMNHIKKKKKNRAFNALSGLGNPKIALNLKNNKFCNFFLNFRGVGNFDIIYFSSSPP